MTHITQQNQTDCGVAVVAMATGARYDQVHWAAEEELAHRGGMTPAFMLYLLETYDGQAWDSKRFGRGLPLDESGIQNGVVLVEIDGHEGHWVLLRGGVVFDPGQAYAVELGVYPKRNKRVLWHMESCE